MTTSFIHYRKFGKSGELDAKGGLTVAIQQWKPAQGNVELTIALAECGRKDVFSRKLGRVISEGRLKVLSAHSPKEDVGDQRVFVVTMPADEPYIKDFVAKQPFIQERVRKLRAGLAQYEVAI